MTADAHHPNPEIARRLEAIYALNTKKSVFRLDEGPYRDLLNALDNPQNRLPPAIHIAGTNGKGSTLAFLQRLFEAAGLCVHAYTSPHLMTFNERITLAGRMIDDDTLIRYLDMIETTNAGAPLTFFEFTTAMAFQAMADTPADLCLIETGLGGRLDCTNVIERPLATVITAIGFDHMDWLGATIDKIAAEKAGIMKAGAPCIIAPQPYGDAVRAVFKHKAQEVDCPIHFVERLPDLPPLGLLGDHQKDNASTALMTFSVIASKIPACAGMTTEGIKTALSRTYWPARMEKVSTNPEIWFDCGHNADGALAIATQMQAWKAENPDRPIHIILGLAADKDPNAFMAPLWAYCDALTCVDLMNARHPQSGTALKNRLATTSVPIHINITARDAIQAQPADALTLVTGSLYLYEQIKD